MVFSKLLSVLLLWNFAAASDIQSYSQSNSDFSTHFFGNIVNGNEDKNIIVSPASVHSCLAMTFLGANGATAKEMVEGLHFSTNDKNDIAERAEQIFGSLPEQIKFANRIYLNKGATIKPDFNDLVKKSFKAEAEILDFQKAEESAQTINQWVENNTNNKIKDLVKSSTVKDAIMILVNAVHFKGKWLKPFSYTKTSEFWISKDKSIQTELMDKQSRFNYGKLDNLDATAIELPYESSDFSMLVILPNERDGLMDLENKLKNTDLIKESASLEMELVKVSFPKFEFEYGINLKNILKNMGMKTMFEDDADFSAMMSGPPLKVTKVVHKAYIKLDENGTEAAAATYVAMGLGSSMMREEPKYFTVDHPFVFVIKDKSAIYFLGHVVNP